MFGRCPSSNSASKVEPITWEIRPVIVAVAMCERSLFECRSRADDVGQLARDLVLAGAVVLPRERLDEVVGVLGGAAHGDHPRDLLADGRVEEALEQPDLERDRHDLLEDAAGVGQELIGDRLPLSAGRSLLAAAGFACRTEGAARPMSAVVIGSRVWTVATCRDDETNWV